MVPNLGTRPDYYVYTSDVATGDSTTVYWAYSYANADPVDDYVPPTPQEIREAVKRGWIADAPAALMMAIACSPRRVRDQSSDRGIGCLNYRRAP